MYTIISATNRNGSHSEKVAMQYEILFQKKNIEAQIFSLKELNVLERNDDFNNAEEQFLFSAQKFVFIMPEYNGSFPGAVKAMIDISDIRKAWWGKKALLTGVSTGRAGNLRGMDHMTGILNYMKMIVHPNKLPISVIDTVMNKEGGINAVTLKLIEQQIDEFINF